MASCNSGQRRPTARSIVLSKALTPSILVNEREPEFILKMRNCVKILISNNFYQGMTTILSLVGMVLAPQLRMERLGENHFQILTRSWILRKDL